MPSDSGCRTSRPSTGTVSRPVPRSYFLSAEGGRGGVSGQWRASPGALQGRARLRTRRSARAHRTWSLVVRRVHGSVALCFPADASAADHCGKDALRVGGGLTRPRACERESGADARRRRGSQGRRLPWGCPRPRCRLWCGRTPHQRRPRQPHLRVCASKGSMGDEGRRRWGGGGGEELRRAREELGGAQEGPVCMCVCVCVRRVCDGCVVCVSITSQSERDKEQRREKPGPLPSQASAGRTSAEDSARHCA